MLFWQINSFREVIYYNYILVMVFSLLMFSGRLLENLMLKKFTKIGIIYSFCRNYKNVRKF